MVESKILFVENNDNIHGVKGKNIFLHQGEDQDQDSDEEDDEFNI